MMGTMLELDMQEAVNYRKQKHSSKWCKIFRKLKNRKKYRKLSFKHHHVLLSSVKHPLSFESTSFLPYLPQYLPQQFQIHLATIVETVDKDLNGHHQDETIIFEVALPMVAGELPDHEEQETNHPHNSTPTARKLLNRHGYKCSSRWL